MKALLSCKHIMLFIIPLYGNAKVAHMDSTSKNERGYDNNAWIFESGRKLEVVVKALIAIWKVSSVV